REAVPLRIERRFVEPERARQIDDPDVLVEQLRRDLGRRLVRRGQKDDFRLRFDERLERERPGDELRVRRIRRSGAAAAGREERPELGVAVTGENAGQFRTGVSRRSDDRYTFRLKISHFLRTSVRRTMRERGAR